MRARPRSSFPRTTRKIALIPLWRATHSGIKANDHKVVCCSQCVGVGACPVAPGPYLTSARSPLFQPPDGRRALSASHDGTLCVWDLESGRRLARMEGHWLWFVACAIIPAGRRALSASADRTLRVWDLRSGEQLARMSGHEGRVIACAVSPSPRRAPRPLRLIRPHAARLGPRSGRELARMEGHAGGVVACAISPDGRRALSASAGCTLRA